MDFKTAFWQEEFEGEIYMQQPEGFIDKRRPDYVSKFNKDIYGLKQAAWNVLEYCNRQCDPCTIFERQQRCN